VHVYACCYTPQDVGRQLFGSDASDSKALSPIAAAVGGSSGSSDDVLSHKQPQFGQKQQCPTVTDEDKNTGDVIGGAVYSKVGSSELSIQEAVMIAAVVACSSLYNWFCCLMCICCQSPCTPCLFS
jgi:hypothetical protein